MNTNGYTGSKGRFCQAVTSGMIFSLIFVTSSRDLHAVQFLDLLSDIPLAHAAGVQRQDLILHSVRVSVILADDLGFEGAIPVPGNL